MQIVTNRKKVEFIERQSTGKRHAIALSPFASFLHVLKSPRYSLIFALLRVHYFKMATVQNFNALLVKFETNVNNYASFQNTTAPDVADNIRSIRSWVEEQKNNSIEESRNNKITDVGKVIETSIDSLKSLSSGNPVDVMKGCLSIVSSVATVVGGPYGAAAGALCGILGSVLSLSTPSQPDLATVFIEKVRVELKKFNQELKSQTFGGLQSRVRNMNTYLKTLQKSNASKDIDIPDRALFETDFPQFIGEVAHNITKGLSHDSKEEDINDCLQSMVVYCNAQTSLLLLLTNIIATFQSTGREIVFLQNLLDAQKEDAIQKLGFLSDEKHMTPSSALPTGGGKVWMILHLRKNLPSYEIVEEFRQGQGMTRMPELETIRMKAFEAAFSGPKGISHLYPQPQTKGDNHYFQLINHTDVPIKVVCGTTGDHVNGLEFRQDVQPRSSYEHVATKSTWTFSTGGFFIIYLDGRMRSFESMFEGQNFKVFEFALSNPFIGFMKSAILEKTHDLLWVNGQDCWKQMNSNASPPIYFVHAGKYYVVFGGYTGCVYIEGVIDYPGKNSCRTWRFVVQEYDPLEDVEMGKCVVL